MTCARRGLGALPVAVVLLLAGCADPPATPEQQVRAVIDAMEQAVEAGSVRQASELMHPQYADDWHANRAAAMRTLLGYLRRHREIHLFTLVKAVEFTAREDAATAMVYVAMTAVPVDSVETLVSLKADLYRFDVKLVRADDAWRIGYSRWKRADLKVL